MVTCCVRGQYVLIFPRFFLSDLVKCYPRRWSTECICVEIDPNDPHNHYTLGGMLNVVFNLQHKPMIALSDTDVNLRVADHTLSAYLSCLSFEDR